MAQGLNKEYIFNYEDEIQKYLNILHKNSKEFNLNIVAYCIMNNHVHLLIYSKNIKEVSEFMRRVNTTYAMYYNKKHNRCGYVFRNRYKLQEIYTKTQLISCINYIHNNPVKAGMCKNRQDYKYSSYNDYINKTGFINDKLIKQCFGSEEINYKEAYENDYECDKFIEYYDAEKEKHTKKQIIRKFMKEKNLKLDEIINNKIYLREIVEKLYTECNITQKEIGETLGVSRLKVHRILKK